MNSIVHHTTLITRLGVYAVVLYCGANVAGASDPIVHRFSLWGKLENKIEKLHFYMGFTNGLLEGAGAPLRTDETPGRKLLECLLQPSSLGTEQAIAMIDRYYRENPAKWDIPIGQAIIEALMVKDGPCSATRSQ